ncbi:hypothetical protein QQ045_019100 [Rhodiola kirilowii]
MPRRAEGRRAGRRVMREMVCCCARAVSGAIVGLLLTWFQYDLMFTPYPPGCYFIQEEVIVSQADDGRLKVTDAPALIHSYVETPGLNVRYENIRAVLKLGEGYNGELITRSIELPDVDLGYERFHAWKIPFNGSCSSSVVPPVRFHPAGKNLSSYGPLTLEMKMKMPWYSSWSVRWGIFHNVKITCPFDPNSINSPVKCIVTS